MCIYNNICLLEKSLKTQNRASFLHTLVKRWFGSCGLITTVLFTKYFRRTITIPKIMILGIVIDQSENFCYLLRESRYSLFLKIILFFSSIFVYNDDI